MSTKSRLKLLIGAVAMPVSAYYGYKAFPKHPIAGAIGGWIIVGGSINLIASAIIGDDAPQAPMITDTTVRLGALGDLSVIPIAPTALGISNDPSIPIRDSITRGRSN